MARSYEKPQQDVYVQVCATEAVLQLRGMVRPSVQLEEASRQTSRSRACWKRENADGKTNLDANSTTAVLR